MTDDANDDMNDMTADTPELDTPELDTPEAGTDARRRALLARATETDTMVTDA